jgi:hypothetical protein
MARPEWEDLKKRLEFSEHKRALLQNRLSKGGIEEDATLWSFVDLMTLLLILFILFYSHAVTHKGSAKNISNSAETGYIQNRGRKPGRIFRAIRATGIANCL